jgi:hypothetical protein
MDARKHGIGIIEDFSMSFLILNINGIIMIDDYYADREQNPLTAPKWAVNMMLFQYQNRINVIHKGKRCIIKKTSTTRDWIKQKTF